MKKKNVFLIGMKLIYSITYFLTEDLRALVTLHSIMDGLFIISENGGVQHLVLSNLWYIL